MAATPIRAETASSVGLIKPAVVFIKLPAARETGSGVVIYTGASGSVIVTAAHVVKPGGDIYVYFQGDKDHPLSASVMHVDSVDDLAILHTKERAESQASLASDVTSGDPIAILGYPTATSYAIASTGELEPEALLGAVTSVRLHGSLISTNAPNVPGDSGAPIFEQDGAKVVGIVTGHFGKSKYIGFQGTAVQALRKFLKTERIAFYGANGLESGARPDTSRYAGVSGMQLLQEASGAHRLLVGLALNVQWQLATVSTNGQVSSANQNDSLVYTSALRKEVSTSLAPSLSAALSDDFVPLQTASSTAELGALAYQRGYVGAVQEIFTLRTSQKSLGFINVFEVSAQVNVIDRYGDIIFSASGTKAKQQPLSFTQQQVDDTWGGVTQDVVTQIEDLATASGSDTGKNFGRFGIPLATGEKSSFISVIPDDKGARVSSLYPYGTAARSTLQINDLIVALDGQDLAKMPSQQLNDLFNKHAGSAYRCTVLEPDGQAVVVGFEAEDIRWYLKHPIAPTKSP